MLPRDFNWGLVASQSGAVIYRYASTLLGALRGDATAQHTTADHSEIAGAINAAYLCRWSRLVTLRKASTPRDWDFCDCMIVCGVQLGLGHIENCTYLLHDLYAGMVEV